MQFSRNIRSLASRIENNTVKKVKLSASTALVALVNGTPVDEGVARSNWRVSLVNPVRVVIPAYSPGSKLGIGERTNAKAAISAGKIKINQLRAGPSRRGAGSAVFITNPVPYLGKLRNKHSAQQPVDWVDAALQEGLTTSSKIRLLSRN